MSTDGNPSRPSFEVTAPEDPRGRSPTEAHHPSLVSFSDTVRLGAKPTSRGTSPRAVSRRGSGSLSRAQSRTSDGIGRTLSRLTGIRSREKLPADEQPAEVHVREIVTESSSTTNVPQTKVEAVPSTAHPHTSSHGHRREKSKNRLKKHAGKGKELDRECAVM